MPGSGIWAAAFVIRKLSTVWVSDSSSKSSTPNNNSMVCPARKVTSTLLTARSSMVKRAGWEWVQRRLLPFRRRVSVRWRPAACCWMAKTLSTQDAPHGRQRRAPLPSRKPSDAVSRHTRLARASHTVIRPRHRDPRCIRGGETKGRFRLSWRTEHGFRSTFRDWAAERTAYPREVCEMALAHATGDKVEAAYRRGDLFEKRRRLMAEWGRHCNGPPARGSVINLQQA